ncbi:MAG: hypothetical protein WCE23_04020 [Candidatus Binatus sp.]|uniref:hypothetical protein n=1 Tax=Candidatus Binatus sp. TaxID=2811406 RepID=UPI003C72ADCA
MGGLKTTLQVINGMVADGIIQKYAVAGAVAALNYIEPTVTDDLDILVSIDDFQSGASGLATLEPLTSYLRSRGYTEFRKEGIVIEGWPVQFLPVANDLDAEGLNQAVEVELELGSGSAPIKITMLTAEHIVATALKVGRPKDRERILRFIDEKAVNLKVLRDVLNRHHLLEAWSKFCVQMGLPDFNESTFERS